MTDDIPQVTTEEQANRVCQELCWYQDGLHGLFFISAEGDESTCYMPQRMNSGLHITFIEAVNEALQEQWEVIEDEDTGQVIVKICTKEA